MSPFLVPILVSHCVPIASTAAVTTAFAVTTADGIHEERAIAKATAGSLLFLAFCSFQASVNVVAVVGVSIAKATAGALLL